MICHFCLSKAKGIKKGMGLVVGELQLISIDNQMAEHKAIVRSKLQ